MLSLRYWKIWLRIRSDKIGVINISEKMTSHFDQLQICRIGTYKTRNVKKKIRSWNLKKVAGTNFEDYKVSWRNSMVKIRENNNQEKYQSHISLCPRYVWQYQIREFTRLNLKRNYHRGMGQWRWKWDLSLIRNSSLNRNSYQQHFQAH